MSLYTCVEKQLIDNNHDTGHPIQLGPIYDRLMLTKEIKTTIMSNMSIEIMKYGDSHIQELRQSVQHVRLLCQCVRAKRLT